MPLGRRLRPESLTTWLVGAAQARGSGDDAPEVEQAFWDGYETGVDGDAEATTPSSRD